MTGRDRPALLAIVGPTASGKTHMAVEVAARIGAPVEIVSCDSMAVYRELDVVSAKPGPAERAAVSHHLLDVVHVNEPFTAVRYRELARSAILEILERRAIPMLVGGSGLYFRAVVDDLAFAPWDPAVREALERQDPDVLWERLVEADPDAASRIDRRNPRRIVRAVEILELTGRPPSALRGQWEQRAGPWDLTAVGLTWERSELFDRATARVRSMLDAGLVDEVRRARERGLSPTAAQALGVKEVVAHLEGRADADEATELLVRNTKRFIRRQFSWFRADPRIAWLDASALGWEGARDEVVRRFSEAIRPRDRLQH